jgi:hypothetical protein
VPERSVMRAACRRPEAAGGSTPTRPTLSSVANGRRAVVYIDRGLGVRSTGRQVSDVLAELAGLVGGAFPACDWQMPRYMSGRVWRT